MCVARFTLAVNRKGKDKGADFISCVAFGKQAEFIKKYMRKGMKADLSGRITTGSYKDKDEKTVYTTEVTVEDIEFGESKNTQNVQTETKPEQNDWQNVPDDLDSELPFN
jgi:single-strand DNA-binding protein